MRRGACHPFVQLVRFPFPCRTPREDAGITSERAKPNTKHQDSQSSHGNNTGHEEDKSQTRAHWELVGASHRSVSMKLLHDSPPMPGVPTGFESSPRGSMA